MAIDGFEQQIAATLRFEGGYVNNPDDPGGETNFGISKRSYPTLDIAKLTEAQATDIYRADYWDRPGYAKLPAGIGAKIFDIGVMSGQKRAVQLLQRAANGSGWLPPLAIDGQLGRLTIGAAFGIPAERLLPAIRLEAKNYYIELATEHPALRQFLRGWLRRAAA